MFKGIKFDDRPLEKIILDAMEYIRNLPQEPEPLRFYVSYENWKKYQELGIINEKGQFLYKETDHEE